MIKTLADFLEAFKANAERQVAPFQKKVEHPVIIGNMYEGLTKEMLSKALPEGLDLRYVSGKIRNSEDKLSGQIDCMLVKGPGEKIPFTTDEIHHINDVLAVIEVKTNLFGKDLEDSHRLFQTIRDLIDPTEVESNSIRNAFRNITNIYLEDLNDHKNLNINLQYLYHTIVVQRLLPIRIALGYKGYATEYSLRKGFLDYLGEHPNEKGFGPASLPDLICCRSNSIIKMTGIPYSARMKKDDLDWLAFASYGRNPMLLILELIFSRLEYLTDMSVAPSVDDVEIENFNPLLACLFGKLKDKEGWQYSSWEISQEDLELTPPTRPWTPEELTKTEYIVLSIIGKKDVNAEDADFADFVKSEGSSFEAIAESLNAKGLAFINSKNNLVGFRREIGMAITPDGKWFAAESLPKLASWIHKNYSRTDSE